jgi:hypothetical protein
MVRAEGRSQRLLPQQLLKQSANHLFSVVFPIVWQYLPHFCGEHSDRLLFCHLLPEQDRRLQPVGGWQRGRPGLPYQGPACVYSRGVSLHTEGVMDADVVNQWERFACNCTRWVVVAGVPRRALAFPHRTGWGLWRIWLARPARR